MISRLTKCVYGSRRSSPQPIGVTINPTVAGDDRPVTVDNLSNAVAYVVDFRCRYMVVVISVPSVRF